MMLNCNQKKLEDRVIGLLTGLAAVASAVAAIITEDT